jgi:hypothetical protein
MHTQQTYAPTRGERLTSVGSVIVAFLASQHSLHMLLMLGLSGASMGAGTSFVTAYPTLRRVMLLVALVMAGGTAYLLVRHRPPLARRVMNVLSIILTLGLFIWSISQFGV